MSVVSSISLIPQRRYGGIKGEPRKFRPFVANREAEILSESDPIQWHHIGTKLNVVDIARRGTACAVEISADSSWIQGPRFQGVV
jgi:hypothetical protein